MKNRVLVIGADRHSTLNIVESLSQRGLNSYVLIVGENINNFVLKSRHVIEGWVCSSPEQVVDEMLKHFSDAKNRVIVYSPHDNVSSVLDSSVQRLSPFFIFPVTNMPGSSEHKMYKEYTSDLAREVGLDAPRIWMVFGREVPADIRFPCITKTIPSVEGSKKNIKICRRREELEEFLTNSEHCPIIQIQKFIIKDLEFQFLGYSMDNGKRIIIPGRTHIDRPNGIGSTFFLKFGQVKPEFLDTLSEAKEFIKRVGYSGTFSIEFLKEESTGKNYFTETSFRNGGNAICQTSTGVNIPYIYYLHCSGGDWRKELSVSTTNTTYSIPEIYYFKCMLKREFSLKEWWRNYRRTTCSIIYFKENQEPFRHSLFRELKTALRNRL